MCVLLSIVYITMYISNIEDLDQYNLQEKHHSLQKFQPPRKASTIMKKPQPLHLKNFQSLKKLYITYVTYYYYILFQVIDNFYLSI